MPQRRTHAGVVALQAAALVLVAADRPRAARAEAEIVRHLHLAAGPDAADFAAHRQHVELADRPPFLGPYPGARVGLAGIQRDADTATHGDQVAFARVVLVVHIAAQPLGRRGQRRQGVFVAAVDLHVILRQQQTPPGFVFHAAVARALAFLQARRAQRESL
ncbi:hypothetical protein G6F68_016728 [Rhizopus microsporus]|nr:hypothetical protein G6F68_016728 [Rhizopus microsporus]